MRCGGCGQPFEPRRRDQRWCSARCRLAGWQAERQATAVAEATAGLTGHLGELTGRDAEIRRLLAAARANLEAAERLLGSGR